jgi:transcription termination/antitermination protein NusG
MIFIIKVTTNKEEKAVDLISERVGKKTLSVYSLARPHGLKGYIILEAADRESAEEAAFNLPYVQGIIGKTVSYEEIQQMLQPKVEEMNIAVGDIVEIIGQTFKGEQAKVTRIDKAKGEVVVSLLGASVPIPVAVKMDNVKVIRREKEESKDEGEEKKESKEDDDFDL